MSATAGASAHVRAKQRNQLGRKAATFIIHKVRRRRLALE